MAFLLLLFCGVFGGVLGGMGMGGGTVLIPLLTFFCGIEQGVAQGLNLLSFLPMSMLALSVHAQNGLLERGSLPYLAIPALLFSVLGALCATVLPSALLKRAFGIFLIVLSFFQFFSLNKAKREEKKGGN